MGIGDWGLGIGDWGLGSGGWAQCPIPNPQSPIPIISILFISYQNIKLIYFIKCIILYKSFIHNIN